MSCLRSVVFLGLSVVRGRTEGGSMRGGGTEKANGNSAPSDMLVSMAVSISRVNGRELSSSNGGDAAVIEGTAFITAARTRGFALYSGVPCSFLTPLINSVIDSKDLRYVGAANEGDAVAI